jgi:hypothetical protein
MLIFAIIIFILITVLIKKNKEGMINDNITIVSGYWNVNNKY